MRKISAILAAAMIAVVGATGCFSLFDWSHNWQHIKAWKEDLDQFHRTADKYIFNYDIDDPYRSHDEQIDR